jgi:hypothetical protein
VIGGAITASLALVFLPWLLAYERRVFANSTVIGLAMLLLALVRRRSSRRSAVAGARWFVRRRSAGRMHEPLPTRGEVHRHVAG